MPSSKRAWSTPSAATRRRSAPSAPLPHQARRSPSRDTSGLWEVDLKRRLLYVTQVKGHVPAYFGECAGDINTRVLVRMRQALEESPTTGPAAQAHRPGPPRRQERRTHQVAAREPWGQHVVPLPLAGKLRLPRAGASPQDQMRQGPRSQGPGLLAPLLHDLRHARGHDRAGLL